MKFLCRNEDVYTVAGSVCVFVSCRSKIFTPRSNQGSEDSDYGD